MEARSHGGLGHGERATAEVLDSKGSDDKEEANGDSAKCSDGQGGGGPCVGSAGLGRFLAGVGVGRGYGERRWGLRL